MENTKILYNAILDFETTIFISRFDRAFEEVLSHLGDCPPKIGQYHRVVHTVTLTDVPIPVEDEYIEKLRSILFFEMKKLIDSRSDINATVEKTEFAGIKSFSTRKI